jgi:hypothetical protein
MQDQNHGEGKDFHAIAGQAPKGVTPAVESIDPGDPAHCPAALPEGVTVRHK